MPLACVEVGGGEVELVLEQAEVVGAIGVAEHRAHVLLDARAGVHPARQRLGEAEHDVHRRDRPELADELAGELGELATAARRPCARTREVGRSSVPTSMSRKGVGTWRLTTRIISSGVMPLAAIEATNGARAVPT
jgi:hypothetical protein